MSTIRNDNTTGGGMYAPSQGINTALTNPNGITSATYSNGAGFGGSAENFVTGNPFKPAPQGYTPYNPALGPTQQPLAPAPAPAPVPAPAPAPGGQMGYIPDEPGPVNADPNQAYATMCGAGFPPQEAAKHALNGTTPPGMPNIPQAALSPYNSTLVPPPAAPTGPQIEEHGGPIQGAAQPTNWQSRQQRGGQYDTSGLGATISGGPPPGYGTGFSGGYGTGFSGPYLSGSNVNPFAETGMNNAELLANRQTGGGPPPGFYGSGPGQQPQGGSGNGTLLSNLMGPRLGGYGYGQGSNVSMMQALQGGGGQGYGDFLSQLLARYGG